MKLAWYVLKEHIAPFFYSLFLITFLFLIQFLIQILDNILSKGLNAWVVLEIIVLNLAWMVALSVPMAVLVASLMAFGRMASDNEITAVKASGISPFRAMIPAITVSLLLCVGLIWFNNFVLPDANHRAAALKSDIGRKKPEALIAPRTIIKDFENYRIWIEDVDRQSGLMSGIRIYQLERGKPLRLTQADSGRMEYVNGGKSLLIHLESGQNHVPDDKNDLNYVRVHFTNQTIAIENVDASLQRHERTYRSDREMSIEAMYQEVQKARAREKKIQEEFQEKVWDELRALDMLIAADTVKDVPPRLLAKPWYGQYPPSHSAYAKLIQQEKDRKYLIQRFARKVEFEKKQASEYLVEIHKKFSIPVACVIFVLIGAPLGVMARRGGVGTGSIYSIIFFLIYWVCLIRGEALADDLILSPWLAMWLPNIIVGGFAVFLVARMARENYLSNATVLGRIVGWSAPLFRRKRWLAQKRAEERGPARAAMEQEVSPPEEGTRFP